MSNSTRVRAARLSGKKRERERFADSAADEKSRLAKRQKLSQSVVDLVKFTKSEATPGIMDSNHFGGSVQSVRNTLAGYYSKFWRKILSSENTNEMLMDFKYSVFNKYDDIRYFSFDALLSLMVTKEKADNRVPSLKNLAKALKSPVQATKSLINFRDSVVQTKLVYILLHTALWSHDVDSFVVTDEDEVDVTLLGTFKYWDDIAAIDKSEARQLYRKMPNAMKKLNNDIWQFVLNLNLSDKLKLLILEDSHQFIIPRVSTPICLSNFFHKSFEIGGLYSLYALHSLFILMTVHKLEFKNFFDKLYGIFQLDMLGNPLLRAKFLPLLNMFLTQSSMLPVSLVCAFVKKCSRFSLYTPLPVTKYLLSLMYHLLMKHTEAMSLIHRIPKNLDTHNHEAFNDRFNVEELSMSRSGATHSSCWELKILQHHFSPSIALLAKQFEQQFMTTKLMNVKRQNFLKGYNELVRNEVGKCKHKESIEVTYGDEFRMNPLTIGFEV